MGTRLPRGYRPSVDEKFMNAKQVEYFRRKLLAWREGIMQESRETLMQIQGDSRKEPVVADRA